MTELNSTVARVTDRIRKRSEQLRKAYLARVESERRPRPHRTELSAGNLAHGFAANEKLEKIKLSLEPVPNIGIVTSYNDMLSAHQPLGRFPDLIKDAARDAGGVAQVAGGVPAMCDGVTQGQPGMELSLFSRDVIAQGTAVALSHNMFDAALCLGVCDKIVPGLLMGALAFGHLPVIFVPGGPMPSGLPNKEKARIRQLFEEGKASRKELLECESQSYHAAGTCTFYGTANTNQMMMEMMGLHLPGAAFVNPNTPLRDELTRACARRALEITALGDDYRPIGQIVDERAIVNAIVGLLATGGSTNHTIHIVAIARVAGILIDWEDFQDLSAAVPLLARIYPNGSADVNHFHAAGGMGFLVRELLGAGLVHPDVMTVAGDQLNDYANEPMFDEGTGLTWRAAPAESGDPEVLRPASEPFSADGGLRLLKGNLGRAVIKVSAVDPKHRVVEAPARVFEGQDALKEAFQAGELNRDVICVVRFQGPKANGMPELHKLTPSLGVLQDRGFKVALVTDGRMSGASGKVPAAIHLTPEGLAGGDIAKIRDGDRVRLDAESGVLEVLVPDSEWSQRAPVEAHTAEHEFGMGRELFRSFRAHVSGAEEGAISLGI